MSKIYTLKNYADSEYASIDAGPLLWSGSADNAEHAAALAHADLIRQGIDPGFINPGDFEAHDDPYDSPQGRAWRAQQASKK